MVGTRKSAPELKAAAGSGKGDNIPKELRKLHIDGKDTMYGEAKKVTQGDVYHWRGAVYVVTADTPQEWIDAEPERFRKKQTPEVETSKTQNANKKKRKSADMDDDVIEVPTDAEEPAKKRSRSMPNLKAQTTSKRKRKSGESLRAQDQLAEAGDEEDEPPAKRIRPDRVAKECEQARKQAQEKARKSGKYTVRTSMLSEEHMLPPREKPKEEQLGFKVLVGIVKLAKLNSRIERLGNIYEKMKARGAYSGIVKRRRRTTQSVDRQSQSSPEDGAAEDDEVEGGESVRRNEEVLIETEDEDDSSDDDPRKIQDGKDEDDTEDSLEKEDDGVDELSADFIDQVQQYSQQADLEEQQSIRAQLESQLQAGIEHESEEEEESANIEAEPDNTADSSDSQYKSDRWDSATSLPDEPASTSSHTTPEQEIPDVPQEDARKGLQKDLQEHGSQDDQGSEDEDEDEAERTSPQVQIKPNIKQANRPSLSRFDRGGKRLRWSLDGGGMRYVDPSEPERTRKSMPLQNKHRPEAAPERIQLADRLGNSERAESMIFRGRMDGESHMARRRRIRREMNILRNMPRAEEYED